MLSRLGAVRARWHDALESTMNSMAQTNGKIKRLSREEIAALTRPAAATTPAQKRAALDRATRGLRVGVKVTESLYRRRYRR